MELLNKKELRKVCKDLGMSRKEFKNAHKEVYGNENPTNEFGKYVAAGTLAGVSMIPSLALADSLPAEVEKVKEEKKERFLKIDGCLNVNAVASKPFAHFQNDFNLYVGKFVKLNDWLDGGLVGGKDGEEKFTKLYNEIKVYFAPSLPIQPVVGADMERGKKTVYRGGFATKTIEVIKNRLKICVEYYPVSNNEEDLVWIKTDLSLGKLGNLFHMTRGFYDKSKGNDGDNFKRLHRFKYYKNLGNGFQLAFNYWNLPKKKKGVYMLGASYRY